MNNSKLPDKILTLRNFISETSIKFDNNDVFKIIRSSNVNNAHGHDGISVRMIKLCEESLIQPLSLVNCHIINCQGLY